MPVLCCLKVLHLTGEREDVGGVLSVVRNVQSGSRESECSHYVFVHNSYVETRRPELTYRFSRHIIGDAPSHFYLLVQSLRTSRELKRLFAAEPFDIVNAHTRGGLLAILPLLRTSAPSLVFTNHSYARRIGLYRWAARRPQLNTVVLTPNMARHYGLSENSPHVSIISDCCADSYFEQPLATKRAGGEDDRVQIVGVGSITPWKNWRLVAEALRRLNAGEQRKLEFSLWGPTPQDIESEIYDRELRQYVRESNLESCFRFRGATNDIVGVLRASDWFLLPSTNEPCSVALIEALALGVPVLVSRSGGNIDIVQHERTGLLFAPDNPDDLAAQLRRILSGTARFGSAQERRESVRHRSGSQVAAQYLALYKSILARRGARGVSA